MKSKFLTLFIGTMLSFNAFSATDGTVTSSSSEGSINVVMSVDPFISVGNLSDMFFTSVNPAAIDSEYSQTLETDICVYTNSFSYSLSIIPMNGHMSNSDYTQISPESLRDNIPVSYSLFSNQYSEEGLKVNEVELASDFTDTYDSSFFAADPNISSVNCLDQITGNTINNYTLKGTVYAGYLSGAAYGDYSQVVLIRASVPMF